MKNFIDISNSMAGSVTVDIKIKECCVKGKKQVKNEQVISWKVAQRVNTKRI